MIASVEDVFHTWYSAIIIKTWPIYSSFYPGHNLVPLDDIFQKWSENLQGSSSEDEMLYRNESFYFRHSLLQIQQTFSYKKNIELRLNRWTIGRTNKYLLDYGKKRA